MREMSKIAKILLCCMVVLSMLMPNVFAESTVELPTSSNWTVKYEASEGGRVEGTLEERVEDQKNPQANIIATAQEGYAFSHWIDNEGNSYSTSEEVKVKIVSKDITFTALFEKNIESEDMEKIEESNTPVPDSLLMNKQLDTLTLSNPRLKVETTGDFKVASNSEKGYIASIRAESTNSADGVNQVWIGYRFTLPVPNGIPNTWLEFTDVSYSWLKDLGTGTSTAKPRYDTVTGSWILEGKFYYDQAQGLGSSAVQEYGRSISISTSWMSEGQKIEPTIEVWLVDKVGETPQTNVGDIVTIENFPKVKMGMQNFTEVASGLYSATTKKVYLTKNAADADGATDAVAGRIFHFALSSVTEAIKGNEPLKNNEEIIFSIPLQVTTSAGIETNPNLQPILLSAHYDTLPNKGINNYTSGMIGDMSYGGRVVDVIGDYSGNKNDVNNGVMKSVSYTNNTITSTLTAENLNSNIPGYTNSRGYYQIFVPVDSTDTDMTKRRIIVGKVSTVSAVHTSGKVTTNQEIETSYAGNLAVNPISNEIVDFSGAYTRTFRFDHSSKTTVAVGSGASGTEILMSLTNVKSELWAEIEAFDMLVKVDAEVYKIDTSISSIKSQGLDNYGAGSYPIKYGVLPSGMNWVSDDAMNQARTSDLVFYEAGNVPEDKTVVAILIEGRGGRLGKNSLGFSLRNVHITNDANKAGRVYQAVLDIDLWANGANPVTDAPSAVMYASDGSGYKKASYDADGTYHVDSPAHLTGDSLLVLAYKMTGKPENLNGTNRPAGSIATTTFDVANGQRTADISHQFTIEWLGDTENENKDFEIPIRLSIPQAVGNAVLDPDSMRLNATYTPGNDEGSPGTIVGGIRPTLIEDVGGKYGYGHRWYEVTFIVKGSGTYTITSAVQLGDPYDPTKDVPIGRISYGPQSASSGAGIPIVAGNTSGSNNFIITKSNKAGFQKVAVSNATSKDGVVSYKMMLSAQEQDLTDSLLLDVLPFNDDGRGTVMTNQYTVENPIKLTLYTEGREVRTNLEFYYTTDAAIQSTPLRKISDFETVNIQGDSFIDNDGITWHRAIKTSSGNEYYYEVSPNSKAILSAGMVGSNESPVVDLQIKLNNMQPGDKLQNSAGFDANEFSKPMEDSSSSVFVADRKITGKAWVDMNLDGEQDVNEQGLSGLTVKLYQDNVEILLDASGNPYNVITDSDGNYIFEHVPSSSEAYHVKFSGGRIDEYLVTEKSKVGIAEDKNSDVSKDPIDGVMTNAISDEVFLLTEEQQGISNKVLDKKQIDAGFIPAKVDYQVTYYQEQLDGSYQLQETITKQGATNTEATATIKDYEGFSHDATNPNNVLTGTIVGDGSLVLKVYYTRNSYTVTFKDWDGKVLTTESKKYGDTIVKPEEPSRPGYTFTGWQSETGNTVKRVLFSVAGTMPAYDLSYIATHTLIPLPPNPENPSQGRTCQDDGYPEGYYWNGVGCIAPSGYKVPNTGI